MGLSTFTPDFPLKTLVFTIHENEIRSARIDRIVLDEKGTNYMLEIDEKYVERSSNQIDKTKEDLFNKMVMRHVARKQR